MDTGAVALGDPIFDEALPAGVGWLQATTDHAVLRIEGVAVFEIHRGRVVQTTPEPGADPRRVPVWRHGLVTVLALAQDGIIALHATSVEIGDKVIALAGFPGAGKSTTALELCRRGHRLVADDVSPLSRPASSGVTLTPTGRPLHVWPDAAHAVGLELPDEPDTIPGTNKLILPVPTADPVAVDAIAMIARADDLAAVASQRLGPAEAVPRLSALVHCGSVVRRIWPNEVFSWAASLASVLPVWSVTRPAAVHTVREMADLVERLCA